MPFDLTSEEWSSLLQGLARGSTRCCWGRCKFGATGGDGRPLPDAKTLAKEAGYGSASTRPMEMSS